jgi:phenolic acid decarboxylase
VFKYMYNNNYKYIFVKIIHNLERIEYRVCSASWQTRWTSAADHLSILFPDTVGTYI